MYLCSDHLSPDVLCIQSVKLCPVIYLLNRLNRSYRFPDKSMVLFKITVSLNKSVRNIHLSMGTYSYESLYNKPIKVTQ